MKNKSEKTIEWQYVGGKLEIPENYCVTHADFDCKDPFITIVNTTDNQYNDKRKLLVPKPLAYYLSTHSCGSTVMKGIIEKNIQYKIQKQITEALGIE